MSYGMARGGQFLHDNGIAHMDIKANNFVYDTHFNLRYMALSVMDKEEQIEGGIEGGIRGSVFSMAPEVRDVDEGSYNPIQADQYSCGVVLGNRTEDYAGSTVDPIAIYVL